MRQAKSLILAIGQVLPFFKQQVKHTHSSEGNCLPQREIKKSLYWPLAHYFSSSTFSHSLSPPAGQMILVCCLIKTIYPLVRSPSETQTGQTHRLSFILDRCVAMATVGVLFTKFKRGMGGVKRLSTEYIFIFQNAKEMDPFFYQIQSTICFSTRCAFSHLSLCYRIFLEHCIFLPGILLSALPHPASRTERRYFTLFQN